MDRKVFLFYKSNKVQLKLLILVPLGHFVELKFAYINNTNRKNEFFFRTKLIRKKLLIIKLVLIPCFFVNLVLWIPQSITHKYLKDHSVATRISEDIYDSNPWNTLLGDWMIQIDRYWVAITYFLEAVSLTISCVYMKNLSAWFTSSKSVLSSSDRRPFNQFCTIICCPSKKLLHYRTS